MTSRETHNACAVPTQRPRRSVSSGRESARSATTGVLSELRAEESCGFEGLPVLRMAKTDTALRELKAVDAPFEFILEKPLGNRSFDALREDGVLSSALYVARCLSHDHRDLAHCVVKVTEDKELAHNEWDHLLNMRSSVLPTPFLMGRVEGFVKDVERAEDIENAGCTEGIGLVEGAERFDLFERYAIVMEYVQGDTLSSLIARGFGEDAGPAPVEKALEIMSPLAGAFRDLALSLHPFVHRDVKPDNIIVGEQRGRRRTRLVDLGVSSHVGDPRQREHLGFSAGFAAPEIAGVDEYPDGAVFSIDDARIDTYGLAATLYALVCGYPPRAGVALEVGLLRHDAATVADIARTSCESIRTKHGIEPDERFVESLVARVVVAHDAAFARALEKGLAFLQSERPTPLEFFDMLPTNYRVSIANDVHLLFLESLVGGASGVSQQLNTVLLEDGDSVNLTDTALDDTYRYPDFHDDFHRAMSAYNAGDYATAVPLLMKLDEAGDPTSSYNLGVCYKDGLGGLERDDLKKLACWTRAAEGGHVVAVFNVGVCHEEGLGVPKTPEMRKAALAWYERAAAGGFPAAAARAEVLRSQLR